ncbi:hypothetical protein BOTBODRAFT_174169 [Botryobasidium botryosum FD-172 SS1]|uniref:Uncharacterized protein n=1 Tax=Botryobasidium botryosum (strain FD-172 SS1) TaxID=930990 RepID=A0A067MTT3_BOTB1|nr:hypothetical protein BOTBODRAFT_174169 [Botryobasidium botryosum FD-172 SS1]
MSRRGKCNFQPECTLQCGEFRGKTNLTENERDICIDCDHLRSRHEDLDAAASAPAPVPAGTGTHPPIQLSTGMSVQSTIAALAQAGFRTPAQQPTTSTPGPSNTATSTSSISLSTAKQDAKEPNDLVEVGKLVFIPNAALSQVEQDGFMVIKIRAPTDFRLQKLRESGLIIETDVKIGKGWNIQQLTDFFAQKFPSAFHWMENEMDDVPEFPDIPRWKSLKKNNRHLVEVPLPRSGDEIIARSHSKGRSPKVEGVVYICPYHSMPDTAWDPDFTPPAQTSPPKKVEVNELAETSKKVPLFLEDSSDEEPVKKDKGKGKATSSTSTKREKLSSQTTASSFSKTEKTSTTSPGVSVSEDSSEEDIQLLARSKGKHQSSSARPIPSSAAPSTVSTPSLTLPTASASPTPAVSAPFRTPSPPFENLEAEPFIISDDEELPEPNTIVAASIARSRLPISTAALGTGPPVHLSSSALQPLKRTWSEVGSQEDYSLIFEPFRDEAIEDGLNPYKRHK